MDKRTLVEQARRGDRDAFTVLARAEAARLDAAARLILRDRELARDAVQEAMIRAWRDLPGLEQSWLGSFGLAPGVAQMTFTGRFGPLLSLQVLDIDAATNPHRMFLKLPSPAADIGIGPVHDGNSVYSPDGSTVVFGRYWDEHDDTIQGRGLSISRTRTATGCRAASTR